MSFLPALHPAKARQPSLSHSEAKTKPKLARTGGNRSSTMTANKDVPGLPEARKLSGEVLHLKQSSSKSYAHELIPGGLPLKVKRERHLRQKPDFSVRLHKLDRDGHKRRQAAVRQGHAEVVRLEKQAAMWQAKADRLRARHQHAKSLATILEELQPSRIDPDCPIHNESLRKQPRQQEAEPEKRPRHSVRPKTCAREDVVVVRCTLKKRHAMQSAPKLPALHGACTCRLDLPYNRAATASTGLGALGIAIGDAESRRDSARISTRGEKETESWRDELLVGIPGLEGFTTQAAATMLRPENIIDDDECVENGTNNQLKAYQVLDDPFCKKMRRLKHKNTMSCLQKKKVKSGRLLRGRDGRGESKTLATHINEMHNDDVEKPVP
eukprot:scpid85812/ scgid21361/ 